MAGPRLTPVLIWGAGAIGGTLGAHWARSGLDVTMVDIVPEHVEACRGPGLGIEGPVTTFVQRVNCVIPDAVRDRYPLIVLAVKAQATEAAMEQLLPHLAEEGFVLSAQNGLNELAIAHGAGAERTMGAFVNFGADWLGPGRILYGNRGAVAVGEIDGSLRERTRAVRDLMRILEPDAVATDDIWGYLWGKLTYGAMLFATALTPQSMAENFGDPALAPAFIALAREVTAVARARGVRPRGFNGLDPTAFAPDASEDAARASLAALAEFNRHTAKTHSGVYRDLAVRRRKTEVDPQLGIVARFGSEAGVATPVLEKLIELIHEIEGGRRSPSAGNFEPMLARCA